MRKEQAKRRGLTIIELVFTMTLVVVLAYLSLNALKPGTKTTPTQGMALSIIDEFEAAKQLAVRSGQPVAVGIPTNNGTNPTGTSIYRIKGWNVPYVTWSKGYSGDYPTAGFAAATWTGAPAVSTTSLPLPASAKFFNFNNLTELNGWLPDDTENDYIFCFLPDGSLVTNNLPSSNGRYTLVVADRPAFTAGAPSGVQITGCEALPMVIYISPNGGVELKTGCEGATLGTGAATVNGSTPKPRTQVTGVEDIVLSDLIVRPNPSAVPGEGVCVPGQYVTLEIWAYSPQGIPLFANWIHNPGSLTGQKGLLAYPDGHGGGLPGEADRMEYVPMDRVPPSPPSPAARTAVLNGPTWASTPPPAGTQGLFRAQWTFTVPIVSEEGDEYEVRVNVQNQTQTANIINPGNFFKINPAPKGRMVVEKFSGPPDNVWQLWRMNPDGSAAKQISPPGLEEIMPTIDRAGNRICFIQGQGANRRVKVTPLESRTPEWEMSPGPGNYTAASISPDGTWVAFRDNDLGQLVVTRVDGSTSFSVPQTWAGGGPAIKKSRPGWSFDGRYVLFGNDTVVQSVDLQDPFRTVRDVSISVDTGGGNERVFAPTSFMAGGQEYLLFSAGNEDPVLICFAVNAAHYAGATYSPAPNSMAGFPASPDLNGPGPGAGSGGTDDDFPSVSLDNPPKMLITRSPQNFPYPAEDEGAQRVEVFDWAGGRFEGPATPGNVIGGDVRRAVYIP